MSTSDQTNTIDEPEYDGSRCATCGKSVFHSVAAGGWTHWDQDANADHSAWVRAKS